MHIRTATNLDRDNIRALHLGAFSEDEREIVSSLAVNLLAEKTSPQTFALVAEADHLVVGHISFSPVALENNDGVQGYILAPLAVSPQYQNRRIGSMLIAAGLRQLSQMNVDMLFVYGDPGYYGRFGFDAGIACAYAPPYELQYSFGWQAKSLADVKTSPASGKLTCVSSLRDPQLW